MTDLERQIQDTLRARTESAEARKKRIKNAARSAGVPAAITEPVTDDEIARVRAHTARMMAQSAATLTPDERRLAHAASVETNSRAHLASLQTQLERGDYETLTAHAATMRLTRQTLTHALAEQGRYSAAMEYASGAEKEHLARLLDAIAIPNEEECSCEDPWIPEYDSEGMATGYQLQMPRYQIAGRVPSKSLHVVECLYCGHMNARPDLPALLDLKIGTEATYRASKQQPADIAVFPRRRVEKCLTPAT